MLNNNNNFQGYQFLQGLSNLMPQNAQNTGNPFAQRLQLEQEVNPQQIPPQALPSLLKLLQQNYGYVEAGPLG